MKSENTNCSVCAGDRLSAFLDGKLDGDSMRQVDRHVASCSVCRMELEKLEQTKALLAGLRSTPSVPSDAFWADTYRAARLQAPQSSRQPAWTGFVRRTGLIVGTAGAAAIVALALFSNEPITNTTPTRSAVATVDQIDLTSLMSAHANYISGKKLADGSNNRIIRSDLAAQTSGEPNVVPTDLILAEPPPNASID
ncbi:MAG TPA: zf-HC2 domain-containing protein [Capsulimonadaceae bacterium]